MLNRLGMMKTLANLILDEEILESKMAGTTPVVSLSTASDHIEPGSLFFALRGSRSDGHAFARVVLEKQAAAVVVDREEVFRELEHAVLVRSTREILARAAARWFGEPTKTLQVVGVTGTNGKTTTTYLFRSLWRTLGISSGVVGTVEYHIGDITEPSLLTTPDPITFQRLFHRMKEGGVTHAAVEVSSIALDQYRVTGTQFEVAIFTNLTQDHLDYHGTFENYYQAKKILFRDLPVRMAIINIDDPMGARLCAELKLKRLTFGLSPHSDFHPAEVIFEKAGTRATIVTPVGKFDFFTPLIGNHNLYNCLGVLAGAFALGHDLPSAVQALATATGAPGRLERVALGKATPHVFVDYAHTPDALENVLRSLSELRGNHPGKIVTVFGCGGDRDRGKRPKMAEIASRWSDITIATSDNPRTESPEGIIDEIEAGILLRARIIELCKPKPEEPKGDKF